MTVSSRSRETVGSGGRKLTHPDAKFTWPDGKGAVHSISWEQHQQNMGVSGPAAPADPAPTAPPPDPIFIAQQAAAQRSLALGNAWDQYSLGQIENSYGLGVDVSNPFSRANLLAQQYQRTQAGTSNSYAARGLYNSGAYQSMKDYNAGQYSQQYDALQREYKGQKAAVLQGQMSRYGSTIGDVSQQNIDSVIRALGALA